MNSPPRRIAHFDLDAFFVSVECLLNPELRGKPLVVGGKGDRSVVAACSYEARKFGIHSAMPMRKAEELCPQLTIVQGTRTAYSHYSRIITDLIAGAAPVFEKASIDEFYIDLTGMDRYFNPLQWTIELRQKIMDSTGLPISFGLAPNKMLAKMATNEAKPNGWMQLEPSQVQDFLDPLRVDKIPGVGDHTFRNLLQLGIETIYELRQAKLPLLQQQLGKHGVDLWQKAQGIHTSVVAPWQEAKSISTENTYEQDIKDPAILLQELVRMTEKLGFELRQENKMAGCIAVKIRYPDFETSSRQRSLPYTFYDDELILQARQLFQELYRKGQPVRLLGVRVTELTDEARQTNLFQDMNRKAELYKAIDSVKTKFGKSAIFKAGSTKK
ncbi:DNA polymerase IV [Flavihumibacter sp. CACIAM 22H1]|uniref:DNA polymerase IV n=1 Tax=Flavihumibacter sp. CACIAM 22H1 TaxID=1812911 RepID=UPI0007A7F177|nr:DNA polymerase IV [Flavihumibacter sp. CACIAM 22H1]KYP14418.1 MAG: DNA polymerase IV [Flavihumibacter sp. CACIAM 22H1]